MRPKKQTLAVASSVARAALKLAGPKRSQVLAAYLAETMVPVVSQETRYGAIKFFCPGKIPIYRARSFHRKEPETLRWIESLDPGSTFWDIGANVGVYALYAAFKGLKVLAFEPSASNYYVLCGNIGMNGKEENMSAYCIAFSDTTRLDQLHMSSDQAGAALNTFGGGPSNAAHSQGALGFTIDRFIEIFQPPFPQYLKIDVDGIEQKIVGGAMATLRDPRLKSLLIEIDEKISSAGDSVVERIREAGFEFTNEAGRCRPNARRGFKVFNGIFTRRG